MNTKARSTWPHVDAELLKALPPVLRAVVRALGLVRAVDWLRVHGGVIAYLRPGSAETLRLDADELARLREACAPHLDPRDRLTLPKVDKLLLRARNAQMLKDRRRLSIKAMAQKYHLSTRQILNIQREELEQMSLF